MQESVRNCGQWSTGGGCRRRNALTRFQPKLRHLSSGPLPGLRTTETLDSQNRQLSCISGENRKRSLQRVCGHGKVSFSACKTRSGAKMMNKWWGVSFFPNHLNKQKWATPNTYFLLHPGVHLNGKKRTAQHRNMKGRNQKRCTSPNLSPMPPHNDHDTNTVPIQRTVERFNARDWIFLNHVNPLKNIIT